MTAIVTHLEPGCRPCETIRVRSDQSVVFVVPENLITLRGGGRWRSHSLLLYSSCSCYKFITKEEIDLQSKQEDEREVVGQFYTLISSIAPVSTTGQEEEDRLTDMKDIR